MCVIKTHRIYMFSLSKFKIKQKCSVHVQAKNKCSVLNPYLTVNSDSLDLDEKVDRRMD